MSISSREIMERAYQYRSYSADELRGLAELYEEPELAWQIVEAMLRSSEPWYANTQLTEGLERIAERELKDELGIAGDMEADSYYNAYLGRKAA